MLRLIRIDPNQGTRFSYTSLYNFIEIFENDDQLIDAVKKLGKYRVVNYKGQDTPVSYWNHFVNESYAYVFEN